MQMLRWNLYVKFSQKLQLSKSHMKTNLLHTLCLRLTESKHYHHVILFRYTVSLGIGMTK